MDAKEAAARLVDLATGSIALEYMTDETALRMGAAALREVEQLRALRRKHPLAFGAAKGHPFDDGVGGHLLSFMRGLIELLGDEE